MGSYRMEELIPITAELAVKYGGYENTSVSYERAQRLMEAVMYCIDEYEAYGKNTLAGEKVSAKEAYAAGRKLVEEKVKNLTRIYNEMMPEFKDYGSQCLRDSVIKGIPEFLKYYDMKYCPQDTLLTLDYPVMTDISGLSGVDAVYEFIRCIGIEQRFLREFHPIYVGEVLSGLHVEFELLAENICSIVLRNTVGHIILDKPLSEKGFSREEYEELYRLFQGSSGEEIQNTVKEAIWCIAKQIPGGGKELQDYLEQDTADFTVRIQNAVYHHCFEPIFLKRI